MKLPALYLLALIVSALYYTPVQAQCKAGDAEQKITISLFFKENLNAGDKVSVYIKDKNDKAIVATKLLYDVTDTTKTLDSLLCDIDDEKFTAKTINRNYIIDVIVYAPSNFLKNKSYADLMKMKTNMCGYRVTFARYCDEPTGFDDGCSTKTNTKANFNIQEQ